MACGHLPTRIQAFFDVNFCRRQERTVHDSYFIGDLPCR